MEYRAVGKRCAVILESLHLPIPSIEVISLLESHGFRFLSVDILELARSYIGSVSYQRGAAQANAPELVDCSSFTKWLFGQRGILLPRMAIQQRQHGHIIDPSELTALDLVFTTNGVSFYHDNPNDGVGHVGVVTDIQTVIHATKKAGSVVEMPIEEFIGKKKFRGARRYIPNDHHLHTVTVPEDIEIETSDDLRYFVFRQLPKEQW